MPTQKLPETVSNTPPSARLVYIALRESDSPMSVAELVHRTGTHPRTVQEHLKRFQEVGVVVEAPNPSDGRTPLYRLDR